MSQQFDEYIRVGRLPEYARLLGSRGLMLLRAGQQELKVDLHWDVDDAEHNRREVWLRAEEVEVALVPNASGLASERIVREGQGRLATLDDLKITAQYGRWSGEDVVELETLSISNPREDCHYDVVVYLVERHTAQQGDFGPYHPYLRSNYHRVVRPDEPPNVVGVMLDSAPRPFSESALLTSNVVHTSGPFLLSSANFWTERGVQQFAIERQDDQYGEGYVAVMEGIRERARDTRVPKRAEIVKRQKRDKACPSVAEG